MRAAPGLSPGVSTARPRACPPGPHAAPAGGPAAVQPVHRRQERLSRNLAHGVAGPRPPPSGSRGWARRDPRPFPQHPGGAGRHDLAPAPRLGLGAWPATSPPPECGSVAQQRQSVARGHLRSRARRAGPRAQPRAPPQLARCAGGARRPGAPGSSWDPRKSRETNEPTLGTPPRLCLRGGREPEAHAVAFLFVSRAGRRLAGRG